MGLNPGIHLNLFYFTTNPLKTHFFFLYADMVKPNSNDDQPLEIQEHIKNEDLEGNVVMCSQCKKELPHNHEAIKHHMVTEHMVVKRSSSVSENSPRNDQTFESADEDDCIQNR
jgi:hypothetical protein